MKQKKDIQNANDKNFKDRHHNTSNHLRAVNIKTIPENEEITDNILISQDKDTNINTTYATASLVKVKRPELYNKTTPSAFGLQLSPGISSNKVIVTTIDNKIDSINDEMMGVNNSNINTPNIKSESNIELNSDICTTVNEKR